jgi:hypothetical protein
MKKILLTITAFFICFSCTLLAQKAGEKAKNATQKVSDKTAKVAADVQETANNVNNTVNNVKTILRVFDPFLVRIKGSSKASVLVGENTNNSQNLPNTEGSVQPTVETTSPTSDIQPTGNLNGNTVENIPNSTTYNSDGTANWGCQDHQKYGSNMDAQRGVILDEVDVATQTGAVDMIFTAQRTQSGAFYHLVSPYYSKTNMGGLLFIGEKYKSGQQPTKQWAVTNTSQIAVTTITGEQFEKVKNNEQLSAVVNQTGGFKEIFDSRTKLDGKVFAIRTQIDNRTSFALIYVVEHVGISGNSCYLKVKLKVNGIDANGDGLPDTN